jgi:uncharacterized membrane protein
VAVADILRVLSVVGAGITAGGMAFVYATIAPVMGGWSPTQSLELHAAMLRYDPDRYIKPSGVIALLASIAVLLVDTRARAASLVLDGAGVVGFLGVVVISQVWNVPVNRRVAALPQPSRAEYLPLRARWLRAHGWRTLSGVLALLLLSVSLAVR